MSYTKLFNSIITSTIWSEDDQTRIVWITMLAIADKNGEVQGSIPGLARIAGVSVESCRAAITKFLSPDLDSRTKDDEGRRIEKIDGGWHLLNHRKYREMASDADRSEKSAIRQARHREKQKRNAQDSNALITHSNAPVTPKSHQIPQADTDTDSNNINKEAKGTVEEFRDYSVSIGLTPDDGEFLHNYWEGNGWMRGKSPIKSWKAAFNTWKAQKWLPSQKDTNLKAKQFSKFDIL